MICIVDEDECASSPCSNGAMCHDLLNGYVCKCTEGFHGTNCQIGETSTAASSATCPECPTVAPVTETTCPEAPTCPTCPECTMDGTTCPACPQVTTPAPETTTICPTPEPDLDYCADDPCQNNGTCFNTTGTYHCDCDMNWTGMNCTEGILKLNV